MPIESIKPGRLLDRLCGAALAVLLLCALAGKAHAGYATIVLDASSGEVLNAVNPDEPNHPASLTKMMTLYLTFQALESGRLKLDQQLPVSALAANKAPTKLGLRAGQTVSVQDCILGMITKSANDAATVVAEALGGSEAHFVETMNAQALMLGMTNTRFASASGLPDPDDATTARDIGRLAMALYKDFPREAPYFATREFNFNGRLVQGHNHLMDRYPGMDGLKTGFTNAAGFNLASTATRDGRRLFGVVLGGRTSEARDQLMARLLDDGFGHRQTPETLVAASGMRERGVARRMLAALSPISTAEAEPAPAHKARPVRRTVSGKASARSVRLAACSVRGKTRANGCVHGAHTPHPERATKLARRGGAKKPTPPVVRQKHDD
ncbi:D-alanyl-D-alanine carboxypeptidase family protein [Frateuria defendens]|uniref:D-alanyl-D-alanine carboxypeptidase family protein n=1 Tax=Frateuria defendens TaxID=2219559 RepID=UPI00069EB539|nr:D-alanyl-D-alanine carboxypeptidase family protein [Frateuria defendens]